MSSIKVKRIKYEIKLIKEDPLNIATAYPHDTGMNIWYAMFMGPYDSPYKNGQYICKILLSENYPFTPPDFVFLTPNGRFDIDKKICLTITGFHSDMWQSTITIKTMLIQIFSVFYQDVDNGIAHLIPPAVGTSPSEREKYAKNSIAFNIAHYKEIYEKFDFTYLNDGSPKINIIPLNNTIGAIVNDKLDDKIINTIVEKNISNTEDVIVKDKEKVIVNDNIEIIIANKEEVIVKKKGRPKKVKNE
jgi:ubiquitin-conjugating enzyme E2 J1